MSVLYGHRRDPERLDGRDGLQCARHERRGDGRPALRARRDGGAGRRVRFQRPFDARQRATARLLPPIRHQHDQLRLPRRRMHYTKLHKFALIAVWYLLNSFIFSLKICTNIIYVYFYKFSVKYCIILFKIPTMQQSARTYADQCTLVHCPTLVHHCTGRPKFMEV